MKHLHIIGIGGTFMGSLALLAQAAGFSVSGCDSKLYPPMSHQLADADISWHEGFDAAQLDDFPADIFIIGNVAKRGMPVIEEILNRNLPYISGPQWLAENILSGCHVLAVAGTHGKTTTASMLAWILQSAGLNPGFLIGGIPRNFGISARLPPKSADTRYFVIEADEYDTAFFDKRSKFVHYRARTAVLNNLEYDHADIFPDLAAIQTQFHHFVRTVPANGLLAVNQNNTALQAVLAKGCWTPVEYFNGNKGLHAETHPGGFILTLPEGGKSEVRWQLDGAHNTANALAAITAARHIGVDIQAACRALASFENVKRRMEIRGTVRGTTVYDDFAHHPSAIAATLAGLRARLPEVQIAAVFEPRSNTMKAGALAAALPAAFIAADKVFCYSGAVDWDIQAALAKLGDKLTINNNLDALVADIARNAPDGSHIVVMSNGSFGGIHEKIIDSLKNQKDK